MNFYPLSKAPQFKEKIDLPSEKTKYYKHYSYRHYIYEEDSEGDTLIDDLKANKDIDISRYNLVELKDIANRLKIPNYNKMNKPDLIKFIRLKLL